MKNFVLVILISILVLGSTSIVVALEKNAIFLTAECTTKGTSWNGSRNSCNSAQQCQKVPSGHVINEKSIHAVCTSCNGSAYNCNYSFSEPVEILSGSGITQPTKLCVSVHARSPKHHHGARGWAKCEYRAQYVRLNN